MGPGLYLFFFAAFLAEIIGSIAGFGSSTIFLPVALQFFDFRIALVLVTFMHIFGNISRVGYFRHGINMKLFLHFGIPSIFFSLLGALLVPYVPQTILKLLLGLVLILYAIYTMWHEKFKVKPTDKNEFVGGAASGFIAGLIGTGGPVRGAFLTAYHLKKNNYIATAALIALGVDLARLPVYLYNGFMKADFYWYIQVLFVVAMIGSFIGNKIVSFLPGSLFRKLILIGLFIIGVHFTITSFIKLYG